MSEHPASLTIELTNLVGLYVCTNGTTATGECLNSGAVLDLSLTMSIYQRLASTVNSRLNGTIMTITELGTPSQVTDLDLDSLRKAIFWILDYKDQNIPVTSTLAFWFWAYLQENSKPYSQYDEYKALESLLTLPLWLFQSNSYANPNMNATSPNAMVTYLPPEFTTTASIARPYDKIRINKSMLMAYLLLEAFALGFSWIVILIILIRQKPSPRITSYPLIDFASKTCQPSAGDSQGMQAQLVRLTGADDGRIRAGLRDTKMLLRASSYQQGDWRRRQSRKSSSLMLVSEESSTLSKVESGMECQ